MFLRFTEITCQYHQSGFRSAIHVICQCVFSKTQPGRIVASIFRRIAEIKEIGGQGRVFAIPLVSVIRSGCKSISNSFYISKVICPGTLSGVGVVAVVGEIRIVDFAGLVGDR